MSASDFVPGSPAATERWLQQELAAAERRHGRAWPQHKTWVEEYLRTELRQALIERTEAMPE